MLLVLSTVAFVSGIFWKSVLVILKQDKIRQIAALMLGSADMTVSHTIGRLISLTLLGLRTCLKYMLHISCWSLMSAIWQTQIPYWMALLFYWTVSFMFAAPDGKDSRLTSQNCLMCVRVYQLICCLITERLPKVIKGSRLSSFKRTRADTRLSF